MIEKATEATIMIIEDNPINLSLLKEILERDGFSIRAFPRAATALTAALANPPDLLLLDINMPEMTGFELCERMKQIPELMDIPVIFVSALTEKSEKIRAFEVGGVDYVTKPYYREEIMARVRVHLDLRKTRQALLAKNDELRSALNELRETQTQMMLAEKMAVKSRLLANISHEIRTPLNAILGNARMIEQNNAAADANRQRIREIRDGGERLKRMLDNVVELVDADDGRTSPDFEWIALDDILDDLDKRFRDPARRKRLTFEISRRDSLPRKIRTDAFKLQRVLSELLDNAIKFTSNGGVVLRVHRRSPSSDEFEQLDDEYLIVQFEVEDTGPGIPSTQIRSIFGRFEQITIGSEAEGGAGLGLAIAREYVRMLGGFLGVESRLGKGSVFRVELTVPSTGSLHAPPIAMPIADTNSEFPGYLGQSFGIIPSPLLTKMQEGASIGDVDSLKDCIAQVDTLDRRLARRLNRLVDTFQYEAITAFLEQEQHHLQEVSGNDRRD